MPDLETILRRYFGCKHPFKAEAPHRLSVSGNNPYARLCCLLEDLGRMGVIRDPAKAVNELDRIVENE